MNPLEQRVKQLEDFVKNLQDYSKIPYRVDEAFRRRLTGEINLAVSGKSASSENRAVDEAGSNTYSVLTAPDGFLQITINNTTYYLPYYG